MSLTSFVAAACMMISGASQPAHIAGDHITGDYVEVRTASVFAGPCHFNSEVVTTGRDAMLAMNISSGKWEGADLAGVRVMAETSSTDNLSIAQAERKSEVIVSESASDAQIKAITDMLNSRYHDSLGEIASVHRAAISFEHKDATYCVASPGFASYKVSGMPNDECCKQPNLVWYSPLIGLTNRKVGYTESAAYIAGTNSDMWQRADENGAFYGQFSF